MFTNRVTMQHKKERGERTKGRKKNKTCFTNIFVIFFVFFFYFFFLVSERIYNVVERKRRVDIG